ncbi:MAG: PilZ domain-containing protein [Terricaulis sp.]
MFGKKSPPDLLQQRVRQFSAAHKATRSDVPLKTRALSPRSLRTPVFKQATLELAPGQRTTVALSDLSETGARIEFSASIAMPRIVVLIEPLSRLRRSCTVVWCDKHGAGLQFLDV